MHTFYPTTTPLFTASHVANFILEKAEKEKRPVDLFKLLKLTYVSYGWVLTLLNKRLFIEPFQPWRIGPVVPSLYHEFKRFGKNPITEKSIYMDEKGEVSYPSLDADESITLIMNKVWELYKNFPHCLIFWEYDADNYYRSFSRDWDGHKTQEIYFLTNEIINDIFRDKIFDYITELPPGEECLPYEGEAIKMGKYEPFPKEILERVLFLVRKLTFELIKKREAKGITEHILLLATREDLKWPFLR